MSDSNYSFIHFGNPNQVLYIEKWSSDDSIPYDDIDTHNLFEATSNLFPQFLLDEEEDGGIPINPANFSAKYYKNRRLSKDRIWSDTHILDRFLNGRMSQNYGDKTILKPLTNKNRPDDDPIHNDELSVAQFLSNGYGNHDSMDVTSTDVNDSIMGNNSDLSINLHTDFIPPNFPVPKRNNSNGNISFGPAQTPKIGRARQPSTDRVYSTPVARRNFTE